MSSSTDAQQSQQPAPSPSTGAQPKTEKQLLKEAKKNAKLAKFNEKKAKQEQQAASVGGGGGGGGSSGEVRGRGRELVGWLVGWLRDSQP